MYRGTKFKVIYLLAGVVILCGFVHFKTIPKCYRNFEGTNKFLFASDERKSFQSTVSTEFKITKEKKVRIHLMDTYEAEFKNEKGETNLKIEIQLSENKKFKEYILAHYKLISEHHKVDHKEDLKLFQFKIDSVDVFSLFDHGVDNLKFGTCVIFPTNKMVIYFQLFLQNDLNILSIEDYTKERNRLIHAYLTHVSKCSKK